MRKFAVAAVAILALVLFAYAVASAYMATQATLVIRKAIVGSPADIGLRFENVEFASEAADRATLRGWYLPAGGTRSVVLVHGIDGNRWDVDHHQDQLAALLVNAGYDVLTFDLRGSGESGGDRLGLGWLERLDVAAAVHFVEARGIQPGHIGLWGQSLGGSSALLATADLPEVGAVVSDAAFADMRPLLDGEIQRRTGLPTIFTPGLSAATRILFGLDLALMPPEQAVPRIAPRPILLIHGTADPRIPVEHAYRLRAAARGPEDELWLVPTAAHVRSFEKEPAHYAAKVLALYDRTLGREVR